MSINKQLDEKGRCCGRKPLPYKRPPLLFCFRCDAAFDVETGGQIENWAYKKTQDGFMPAYPNQQKQGTK